MKAQDDAAQARSRLAEIQARQGQAVRAGSHPPRWFVVGLAGLLLVFYLATWLLQGTWSKVALTAGYLAVIGGLIWLMTRRAPVQVHPSQYDRRRFWLTVVGSAVGMSVIVGMVNAVTPEGPLQGLAVAGVFLLVVPVLHRVSHRWALRRGPAARADTCEGSADGAERDAEGVTR